MTPAARTAPTPVPIERTGKASDSSTGPWGVACAAGALGTALAGAWGVAGSAGESGATGAGGAWGAGAGGDSELTSSLGRARWYTSRVVTPATTDPGAALG